MNRIKLGALAGLVLGLLDGFSAFLTPGTQGMMAMILVGATVKGLVTGLLVGLIARVVGGAVANAMTGTIVGGVLSVAAFLFTGMSIETGDAGSTGVAFLLSSFLPIVVPGVLVGLITGLIVSKWGK